MAATVAKAPAITNIQTTPPQVAHNKAVTSNGNTKIVFNGRQDTSGGYQPQFVIQKLSVTRLPNIVNRMRTETLSSRAKRSRFYKSDSYVDYRCYSWRNLALWSDYQAHLWKGDGSVKTSYRKWNTACKPMVLNLILYVPLQYIYISVCITLSCSVNTLSYSKLKVFQLKKQYYLYMAIIWKNFIWKTYMYFVPLIDAMCWFMDRCCFIYNVY